MKGPGRELAGAPWMSVYLPGREGVYVAAPEDIAQTVEALIEAQRLDAVCREVVHNRMEAQHARRVELPGKGHVLWIAPGETKPVDVPALIAKLEHLAARARQAGMEDVDDAVPLKVLERAAYLRVHGA